MNSVACPGCGLPRQAAHIGVVPCPVCADSDPREPRWATPPPAPERYDPTRGMPADVSELRSATPPRRSWSPAPLLLFAVVMLGVLAVWGWQAFSGVRETASELPATAPVVVLPPPVKPPPAPMPLEVAPPPRVYVAVAPPPHTPFRPPPARVTQVDHPNAVYTPQVPPGATVTLKGRAKTLRVPALEAGATLDVTELVVDEVVVFGKIDGGSRLRIGAVKTRVTFQAKIDGRSTVEVLAPGGTVSFAVPTGPGREGSRISGGSEVRVTARFTTFQGQICGPDTRVIVTVTPGGALGFAELVGPCRLEYRKASPTDPDPTLSTGKVVGAAKVTRID